MSYRQLPFLMIHAETHSALLYNSAEFLGFLKDFFRRHPCFLCGKIHDFHIHGKVIRLIRDNRTYLNIPLCIFVAYCPESKKQGKQYTKRILPPFIIPECNITLENCLKMAEQSRSGPLNIDQACELLGTVCERTVRKHYRQLEQVLKLTISWAMAWLAEFPLVASLPSTRPGKTLYENLQDMYRALLCAKQKTTGIHTTTPAVIRLPAYVLILTKVRNPGSVPLNLVCLINVLFDTS
jgi:hypothetical protein